MTSVQSGSARMASGLADRVLAEAAVCGEEAARFAAELIRIPSVNPPGDAYRECAELLGVRLEADGFETEYIQGPGDDSQRPKINVLGRRRGREARPALHLNGHFDVVPPGEGWTVDPFGGEIRDGYLYGRGSADMKAGLAAAVFAAEAVRRAGIGLRGTVEISGTVDEESGGLAGVAHLAASGRVTSRTTDYVIIPEPFSPGRICIGHRGVLWFRITARGRIAHGSMPFLGTSAIDAAAEAALGLQEAIGDLVTELPVVPEGARRPTINVNSIAGGQVIEGLDSSAALDGHGQGLPSPCVADGRADDDRNRRRSRGEPRDVRSQALPAYRRHRPVRRLRTGRTRAGPPARRTLPALGHHPVDPGDGTHHRRSPELNTGCAGVPAGIPRDASQRRARIAFHRVPPDC